MGTGAAGLGMGTGELGIGPGGLGTMGLGGLMGAGGMGAGGLGNVNPNDMGSILQVSSVSFTHSCSLRCVWSCSVSAL